MKLPDPQAVGVALVVLAAVAGAVWLYRRGVGGVAEDVASGTVKAAGGVVSGTVKGIAAGVGIPATSQTECQKAIAEGRYWDASFACPAGDFIAAGGQAFYTWFRPTQRTP